MLGIGNYNREKQMYPQRFNLDSFHTDAYNVINTRTSNSCY